jgi:hypothetical protein
LERVCHLETVREFGGQQCKQFAVCTYVEWCLTHSCSQTCTQVFVGLRQNVILEVVELHPAFAILVDDPLEQFGFFHCNHFEVRSEIVLDLNLRNVALAVPV